MKIAHICKYISGGAGRAAYRLHRGLIDYGGVESVILHPDTGLNDKNGLVYIPFPKKNIFLRALRKAGMVSTVYDNRKKMLENAGTGEYEVVSFPVTDYRLEKHPAIQEADIIHLHWVGNFIDYPHFFSAIKKPIVWTLHDMNPFMGIFHYEGDLERNSLKYKRLNEAVKKQKHTALANVENISIVCLCKWMKSKSESSDLLGKYKHFIIPNGIDFSGYSRTAGKEELKKAIGINNEHKTFLIVADHVNVKRKGFDLLIGALGLLKDHTINLVIVGSGELKLPSNIISYPQGKITNEQKLVALYNTADLLILPSTEDNLPNVMLEAFACGLPVLSFKTGGMQDYIQHGYNGLFATDMNETALCEAIRDFCEGNYSFSAEEIRKYAESQFALKQQTNKFLQLYNELLQP